MNIICASSVSFGGEAFAPVGKVTLLSETAIDRAAVHNADAVITRSKTLLNRGLFEGSQVSFAGTCTAGIDHADPAGLAELGIHFASAPGCNANGVSEYVLAALLEAHLATGFTFAGKTMGVIGCGEVGSRVCAKAKALGMTVLRNDPPKEAAGAPGLWTPLPELLSRADVLTLHVPLVEEGPWPTRCLIGPAELASLRGGAILINACRGEVTDNVALLAARRSGQLSWLVLDVWDPEPKLPRDLLAAADLASPHIAGHSVEGKVNGTRQILEQLCDHFKIEHTWDPRPLMPPPEHPDIRLPAHGCLETRLHHAVRAAYDIRFDDNLLRSAPDGFNEQRRAYRDRREFAAHRVQGVPDNELSLYTALGFQIASDAERT